MFLMNSIDMLDAAAEKVDELERQVERSPLEKNIELT